MKKVLITVSRGTTVRNILQNEFYRLLREKYTVVILTTAHNDERFLKAFSHPNVEIKELLPEPKKTFFDELLIFFHKHLLYTDHVKFMDRWGIVGNPKSKKPTKLHFYIKYIVFSGLKHIKFLRDVARWIDGTFLQQHLVEQYRIILKKENPSLVFVTHVTSDSEVALLKAAKQEGIKTIGLPKSWDNLSKHGLRAKPDRLVVWNDFMIEQAVDGDNYTLDEVFKFGVPQFDICADKSVYVSREEFCNWFGLDPERKIILFGSEGKLIPSDGEVAEIIFEFIEKDSLGTKAQLLIRPHYGYKDDEKKFASLMGKKHVAIDLCNNPSKGFRDAWDYSREFSARFVNTMYHADVLVTTASTLTLDAACHNTPSINIAFNGRKVLPYDQSVERWYETDYYQKVLSYGATTLVRSPDELQDALIQVLTEPTYKQREITLLRDEMCGKIDGLSGVRLFDYLAKLSR